jgi:hypothetical protein
LSAGQIIMNIYSAAPGRAPALSSVDLLVAEFGARRVVLRALRAFVLRPLPVQRPLPRASVDALEDRLLRDIGLPPRGPAPIDWRDLH